MNARKLAVLIGGLALLALPVAILAQGPGGRGGPGGGFGWGPGMRVLDARAGGCAFEDRGFGKDASTNYYLTLSETITRAILPGFTPPSGTPPTHTVIHTGGVTYVETTLKSDTLVCINDAANHTRFVVKLSSLSPPKGMALEFKLGNPHPGFRGDRPQGGSGNSGQKPAWSGNANPDVKHYTDFSVSQFGADGVTLSPAQSTALAPAFGSWPANCTSLSLTVITHGQSTDARVTCSPLGVTVFTFVNNPSVNSIVAATFMGSTNPTIMLSSDGTLSGYSGITVKVVNGGPGNHRPHGGLGGPGGGA